MKPRLPRRAWPLWLAGVALWFAIVPVAGSHDAPIWFQYLMAAVCLPVVVVMMAPYLIRYRGGGPALVWRARGIVPTALSLLGFGVAGFALLMAVGFAAEGGWRRSGAVFAYWAAWAVYLQLLRAAAIHRARVRGDARRLRTTFG